MHYLRLPSLLLSLIVASTLSHADEQDGPPPGGPERGDHHHEGGDDGEHHGLALTATANAPAGATGVVQVDLSTPGSPALAFSVSGLAAGTYTVNVTSSASTTPVTLGTFDVPDPAVTPGPVTASLALPAGFDLHSLVSIQVTDTGGTVLLSASREGERSEPEHHEFHLSPTADAPADARGHAELNTDNASAPALNVEVRALAAGTYTVDVVSTSTAAETTVGTFDVAASTDSEPTEASATLTLPDGVTPSDIASVKVLDSNNVLLLAGDGSCHGGKIEGHEHLHQEIALTATANAPAGLLGRAELEAEDEDGASAAVLGIGVKGLTAGDYTVSVTSQANGTSTTLGTFTASGTGRDHVVFGTDDGIAFPAGFNPLDIATVQVADSQGNALLTGDFTSTATTGSTSFVAKVATVPGVAAPNAVGSAVLGARIVRHVLHQGFALVAKNTPKNAKLTVKVNGTAVGVVKSNRRGGVSVSGLPKGTQAHKVTSVTLETAAGARVLGAYF